MVPSNPSVVTNPIAVGLPSETDPLVLGRPTSAISWYELVEVISRGDPIPKDAVHAREDAPISDPKKAMDGALRTFDRDLEGSGLSIVIEAMTGPSVGAAFAGLGTSWRTGECLSGAGSP
jgi:L-2-hydroxycarboxylate dehydrogenase (NAD+)